MGKWRQRLYGYTGLFIILGIWTPMLWFISSSRQHYEMVSFEVLEMDWFSILIFVALCVATLIAQFGFIAISKDLAEFERFKEEQAVQRFGGTPNA